ncbi:MAG: CoA pyrophosphatase [Halioglobus sp.]|nr:CoA pyrophosphatase [Halioglobus sp.]
MTKSGDLLQHIASGLPLDTPPWREAFGESRLPQAAVLVALTAEAEPRVLLGRRARHLPQHPGEIAFAGGKREACDASPWATALREAEEEVGLPVALPRALGELQPMITRTGFEVYPCVAGVPADWQWIVDRDEFDSVFLPPLSTFADKAVFRLEEMSYGSKKRMVPHYQVGSDNVWGVTAAILALVANVAYDAGLELQRDWKVEP